VIRIALDSRPLDWQTVTVRLDGQDAELRVRYWLLSPAEAAKRSAERLEVARAFTLQDQGSSVYDLLLQRLSAAEIAGLQELLAERVVDWDLADLDGQKIPVTPQAVRALVDHGAFLRPLYDGLVDASLGGRSKNG
jgi:hypothetical protein